MMRYSEKIISWLFLMFTFAAAVHNKPLKVIRAPYPSAKCFFEKPSVIEDFPSGQLEALRVKISLAELSLVFFYAPWCAESEFAKRLYENLANTYYNEAYFAAVNCWHPSGECQLQYSKVNAWPILMAYYKEGKSLQYSGQWTALSLMQFMESAINPMQRLTSMSTFLRMRREYEALLVGYFENVKMKAFHVYFKAALSWLEESSFQNLKFTVMTGNMISYLNIAPVPAIRLYLWNETMILDESNWSADYIIKWLKNSVHYENSWVDLPAKKSYLLTSYLKESASVLVFTNRENILKYNSDYSDYLLVKQLARVYLGNCQIRNYVLNQTVGLIHQKEEDTMDLKGTEDLRIDEKLRSRNKTYADNCNEKNTVKKKKSDIITYKEDLFKNTWFIKSCEYNSNVSSSMVKQTEDTKSSRNLLIAFRRKNSKKSSFPHDKLKDLNNLNQLKPILNGTTCFNNTLKFLTMDSTAYKNILYRLGNFKSRRKTNVFIVDNKSESTYSLNEPLSVSSLHTFIKNFHEDNLARRLREKKINLESKMKVPSTVKIMEINSRTLNKFMEHSNSTLVISFFSSHCALCNIISLPLLRLSRLLKSVQIEFLRINGDENDFLWQYSMPSFPTIIIVPRNKKSETRIFSHNMEVNEKNIIGFILANLSITERLRALMEICLSVKVKVACYNCISVMRKEIVKNIERNLQIWKKRPLLREKVVENLQILQKAYIISMGYNKICNVTKFKHLFAGLEIM